MKTIKHINCQKEWIIKNNIPRVLFIGDSHIETSVNDINANKYCTFAQSGDNYLYLYCKLRKLLSDNENIDTVILGIDCHNIDTSAIEWYINQNYLNNKFPLVYPFMSNHEIKTLFSLNIFGFMKACPYLLTFDDRLFKKDFIKMYGSYNMVDSSLIYEDFSKESNYSGNLSMIQIEYLDKIRILCSSYRIKLFLITTPVHKSVKSNVRLETFIKNYTNQNSIEYLNYKRIIIPDSCFSDKFHLNKLGSIYFTSFLVKKKIITN